MKLMCFTSELQSLTQPNWSITQIHAFAGVEPEVLVVPLEEPVAVDVVDDVTEVTILLL